MEWEAIKYLALGIRFKNLPIKLAKIKGPKERNIKNQIPMRPNDFIFFRQMQPKANIKKNKVRVDSALNSKNLLCKILFALTDRK